ncbi:dodecin family protein [Dehalogenimonas etheniformans]|uniref:Dodecin domain-containing protein n=1 Tax=Dehalogenimonas etheniformans TaxID=1536648 RepID=A0A2P5P701_9CHLR|nr:dodecin family protein [Dehalogenimonas etheniformans]PPD58086.1 dodecin domain-containing protein [Dehalogenimonas etheniformans]QNT75263.1 dodecin domain-containing protein [Dehalogenimonas etheniformans]
MSISRITEVKSASPISFDDAIRQGVARAEKTLKNIKSAWIANQEVLVNENGDISEYRVHMKITFLLEE